MKKDYNKTFNLRCISCGDMDFESNTDKSWIKCNRCGKVYNGGYDELVELNQENIDNEIKKTGTDIIKDVKKDFEKKLKKAFKNNKNIKFKK